MSSGIKMLITGLSAFFAGVAGSLIFSSVKKGRSLSVKVNPNGKKVLFVGDSLTAYSNSFADQLAKQYPGIRIHKIAVSGKKTDWMLKQLTNELNTGNEYDIIAIMGGVNDIYATGSIDGAMNNLQKMYEFSKYSGAKVIALNVIPTKTYTASTDRTTDLTKSLNAWIKSNGNIDALIDVNSIVNDGHNGTKPDFLQSDTLHLTSSAHAAIANDFASKVFK